ncbi:hypothetical protein BD408DRAFT_411448 [Parasitella parasitica]|nr:hypothetical protein BD408DRAFT_411448 [Parasitella parasitica]
MELCTHQVQYNGLCAVCGSLIEIDSDDPSGAAIGNSNVRMGYDMVGLTVSREEAEKLEAENARRLLKIRKLSLILDLDQTIVHATWDKRLKDAQFKKDDKDIRQFTLPGSDVVYYIKLRPGLAEFLNQVEEMYELHIYTMGTRAYAEAVAKEIDPSGSIFKERILSRDESGSITQKRLQRLFPCDTSMVVVLDDRSDVWSFSPNLIRIKPYEVFTGTDDINGSNHQTTQKVADPLKNDDDDNELSTILQILTTVHTRFYSMSSDDKEADVTHIIPKMKKQVLQGVIITFSDVILNPDLKDPTLSWIWQMATSFGATCSVDLTGKTTHLIAISTSKNKVHAAREYGHCKIVTPLWLLDSTARWKVQPEERYELQEYHTPSPKTPTEDQEPALQDGQEEQEEELVENINWDDANREVEDFINESGIDDIWGDTDSDTVDSSLPSSPLSGWKRKRDSGGESGGDGSDDDNTLSLSSGSILAVRRLKAKRRGKSHLFKVTPAPSSVCTSGNTSDNEDSSLEDFAGILDKALES